MKGSELDQDRMELLIRLSSRKSSPMEEAEGDNDWLMAMQEELTQFERNKVWEFVPISN